MVMEEVNMEEELSIYVGRGESEESQVKRVDVE